MVAFLGNSSAFVETKSCKQVKNLGGRMPVCWDMVRTDASAGSCIAYSVNTLPAGWSYRSKPKDTPKKQLEYWSKREAAGDIEEPVLRQWFAAEVELAEAGCIVHIIANRPVKFSKKFAPPKVNGTGKNGSKAGSIASHQYLVGPTPDPFAEPPVATLEQLMELLGHNR